MLWVAYTRSKGRSLAEVLYKLSEKRAEVLSHLYTRHVLKYVGSTDTLLSAAHPYVVQFHDLLSVMLDYVACGEWFLIPRGRPVPPQSLWKLTSNEAN